MPVIMRLFALPNNDPVPLAELLDIALHFDRHLGSIVAQHGLLAYALLFAIIFVEIGILPLFFLPGDPLLFISGALCATSSMNIWAVMATLFVATVLGSALNFWIASAVGHTLLARERRWLDREALERTRVFFAHRGAATFLLSPFIAVVRTFAPFVAGVAGMSFGRFAAFVAGGALLWVVVLVPGGYWFGNIPVVHDHLGAIVIVGIAAGLGSLVVHRLRRAPRQRHRSGGTNRAHVQDRRHPR